MVTSTVTPPIQSKLADINGRKPLMNNGIVLFLCGSFLCGHVGGMATLVLFRALPGVGAVASPERGTFPAKEDIFPLTCHHSVN